MYGKYIKASKENGAIKWNEWECNGVAFDFPALSVASSIHAVISNEQNLCLLCSVAGWLNRS